MRISDVLSSKPSDRVVTIEPESTVRDLLALLAEHNVGAVVVSTDGDAAVRDAATGESSLHTGAELARGLPLRLRAGQTRRLIVTAQEER